MNDEQRAHALERELKDGCHTEELRPLLEMARVLEQEAQVPGNPLDSSVSISQRNTLLHMASSLSTPPSNREIIEAPKAQQTPPPFYKTKGFHRWFPVVGISSAVAVAAVVLAIVVQRPSSIPFPLPPSSSYELARLIIPEAHAGDAFRVIAERQDAAGADPATSFLVTSAIPVEREQLIQNLRIVPPPSVLVTSTSPVELADVEKVNDTTYRVRPVSPLDSGKVYRVALAAAIQQPDGSLQARDFSWAFQTKQVFRVVSSIPGPNSSNVPVDSVVEFQMSLNGWEDPVSFFSIVPAVKGRFEAHGRSLTFVPEKPFQHATIYTATLRKGLKAKGSEQALERDIVIRFETTAPPTADAKKNAPHVILSDDLLESAPGRDTEVFVYWDSYATQTADVKVTGYALSLDQAKRVLQTYANIPRFAYEKRKSGDAFSSFAKQVAFEVQGKVEIRNSYEHTLVIPGVNEGWYVLKVEPKGGIPTWAFLQSTDVATAVISGQQETVVWSLSVASGHPLANLPVRFGSVDARTSNEGIARFASPAIVSATSTDGGEVIVVGEGKSQALLLLTPSGDRYWGMWYPGQSDQTISYVYLDRPLYRPTDTGHFFGIAQDRATKRGAGALTLELERSGYYDWYWPDRPKVYRRVVVETEGSGFFRGQMEWQGMPSGIYRVALKQGGETLSVQTLEIRDFVKPSFTLEMTTEKYALFSGETVEGEARAQFYSGAPMSGYELALDASGAAQWNQTVRTDASGIVPIRVKTGLSPCDVATNAYCSDTQDVTLTVRPANGEEAQMYDSKTVQVWRSRASLELETAVQDTSVRLQFTARRVDLSRAEQSAWNREVLGAPIAGTKIQGRILKREWVQIENGTSYNYIEKKTFPIYRYELKETEVATVDVTTDAEGSATVPFTMEPKGEYRAVAYVVDAQGSPAQAVDWFGAGWWSRSEHRYEKGVTLDATTPHEEPYHLNERVSVSFFKNDVRVPDAAAPNFLFVKAQLGIKEAVASPRSTYEFAFSEADIPNVVVYGMMYQNGQFVERMFTVPFELKDRELKIQISTDQESYAPGGKGTIQVIAKTKGGEAVANTQVAVGIVDEALYATTFIGDGADPLSSLYAWVSDGILLTRFSHANLDGDRAGGAEMGGGGGGDAVRRNFKDTASFQIVTTDAAGVATVPITFPDNLTSWRITAVGVTSGLSAGSARQNVRVTKPVFVDVVAPSTLNEKDKPVLKLRAYGRGFGSKQPVTFTVDAPTLGLNNQSVTGTSFDPVYVAVDTLPPGEHTLTLKVTSKQGTDALERKIRVLSTRFLRQELVQTEIGPGSALLDIGSAPEVEVTFLSKTRAQYLPLLRSLAWNWSQRVESRVAERIAKELLRRYFDESDVPSEGFLSAYQKSDGGIAILPYASADAELTAKIAGITPGSFDRYALSSYFWSVLQTNESSREEQIRSLAGLSALGEPLLLQLQQAAQLGELNWREQLAVIRGLDAAGDRELARTLLDRFFAKAEERDGQIFVKVTDNKREITEATAEAAALALSMADARAPKLYAWMEKNWSSEALTDLDRAAYLLRAVPAAIGKDVTVRYTLGTGEETLELKDGNLERVTLTAAEANAFRITSVNGPVVAAFTRLTPKVVGSHPDVSLVRTYEKPDRSPVTTLAENDTIESVLKVEWKETAPDGCYTVRDHLPAGMAPLVEYNRGAYDPAWYPVDTDEHSGAVSFAICKSERRTNEPIRYRMRVITRGSYVAEPAVLQSEDAPSVAAVTPAQTLVIQ